MSGPIPYRIRRSDRARRVRVTVDAHAGVEVVLPRRAPERSAREAVDELLPWIESRLAEAREVRDRIAGRAGTVPYLGTDLRLRPVPGRTRAHRVGDDLLVPPGDLDAVERWYRRAARREIEPRLDRAVAELGESYRSLHIRNQRTRWGSCSTMGAMSFNWRLMLAPERVLDYVVWHEACHLRVSDHSERFWALLGRHCNDFCESRSWLRRHGNTLVLE